MQQNKHYSVTLKLSLSRCCSGIFLYQRRTVAAYSTAGEGISPHLSQPEGRESTPFQKIRIDTPFDKLCTGTVLVSQGGYPCLTGLSSTPNGT